MSSSPSNGFLSKELLVTAGVLLASVAVSWGALNADVMALEAKAEAVEAEQSWRNLLVRYKPA